MKILHIIPDLPSGGAEMVVLTYLRQYRMFPNIEMSLISLSKDQGRLYEKMIVDEHLPVKYLNQNIHDNSIRGRISQIFQIRRYIKMQNPDVVHIHLSILWMVCLAIVGLGIKGKFHTLHSNPSKTSYGKNRIIDKWCYRLFHVQPICLNREMCDIANKIFKRSDALSLPNGINFELYQCDCKKEYRRLFNISDDAFVVGHVGRFIKVKNHPLILRSFAELKKIRANSKLILVGEGDDMDAIRCLSKDLGVENDVVFTGARSDVPKLMRMFDVFIFPSLYEGLGIVLIEAQAAGLRCVVSKHIPKEAFVTNSVSVVDSDSDYLQWAHALNDENYPSFHPLMKLQDYSTSNVMHKLIRYYKNSLNK